MEVANGIFAGVRADHDETIHMEDWHPVRSIRTAGADCDLTRGRSRWCGLRNQLCGVRCVGGVLSEVCPRRGCSVGGMFSVIAKWAAVRSGRSPVVTSVRCRGVVCTVRFRPAMPVLMAAEAPVLRAVVLRAFHAAVMIGSGNAGVVQRRVLQ